MTPGATAAQRRFLAVDLGTATTSVALVGRVGGRWRLLGARSAPAATPVDALASHLVRGLVEAEPGLADALGLPADAAAVGELARLVSRTRPAPRLAVLAGSARGCSHLAAVADRSGWRTTGLTLEGRDGLAVTRLLLDRSVRAVLVGADDPPGADERPRIEELARIVVAAAGRRPELDVVLAGGFVDQANAVRMARGDASAGSLLAGPAATVGEPAGEPLRTLLEGLRAAPDDGRVALARSTSTLAGLIGRRVDTIEIGHDAGLRAAARPLGEGGPARLREERAIVASGALVPPDPDDAVVDAVLGWSTIPLDRYRLRDRLRELRLAPWGDAAGEGALIRAAAVRAALGRLLAASPDLDRTPTPELVVASGGAWSVIPGPAITLALADLVRRPGAIQYALDHARLLGPLGTIADEDERRAVMADVLDDLLVPLGTVVMPQGLRAGRDAGRLVVRSGGASTELELVPGGLQLVDLPPGRLAAAELRFRDPVVLGARGRRFEVEVAGGLSGLVVDLRDIPLRLPERPERRRDLLAAWQGALWTEAAS